MAKELLKIAMGLALALGAMTLARAQYEEPMASRPDKSDASSYTSYSPRSSSANDPAAEVAKPKRIRRSSVRRRSRITQSTQSGLPPEGETRFLNNEVLVRFARSSTRRSRNLLIARLGMTHRDVRTFFLAGVTVHRYSLPEGADVRSTIAALEQSAAVISAQPNYLYLLQQDTAASKLKQFANTRINLEAAHRVTSGKSSRIAIIDTAVDSTHVEIKNANLQSFDVSDARDQNIDPHGTAIAGILAADGKLTGVAPDADLISIAAFSKSASGNATGNTWTILDALNVALKNGAEILNLSFAGPFDPLMQQSFEGADRRGMVSVAAAGNEGPTADKLYPAAYQGVIAVTATNSSDEIYADANRGDHLDVAAPGVGILVLSGNSGFRSASGTSMATAYVSGILALAHSANPNLGKDDLKKLLQENAVDIGPPGKDPVFGSGLLDAAPMVAPLTN